MERDSYDDFIEDEDTDLSMASARYTAELERLSETMHRMYPYMGDLVVSPDTITPFTVNNSNIDYMYSSTGSTITADDNIKQDIADLKRALSSVQQELADIKKKLTNTTDKIKSLEHRKITI
jgi:hypothetical protein